MSKPGFRPYDAIARQKSAEDLARLDYLAALDDAIVHISDERDTFRMLETEATRKLSDLTQARAEALESGSVLLLHHGLPVAVRRNPSWRFWLQSFLRPRLGWRRRPDYTAPEVPE